MNAELGMMNAEFCEATQGFAHFPHFAFRIPN